VENAKAGWSEESWWDDYTSLVGFHEGTNDVRTAWRGLRNLIDLGPGTAIFHRSGWGVGEVLELDAKELEVKLRFASGRRDRMPVKSVIETCEVLDPSDLRGLVVRDPEELTRRLKEEPLDSLISVLKRYNGRVNQVVLKSAMAQVGVEGTGFTSWWRKTRKLAETSEQVEVTGTGQKTQIRLLEKKVDPAQSMRRQLKLARDLGAACTRVRDLLTDKNLTEELRSAALETLEELAETPGASEEHRLSAWILLRAETSATPPHLLARLQTAIDAEAPSDPGEAPAIWQLFASMPGAREQDACIGLLREVYGEENWLDQAARYVLFAPPGMTRSLIEQLASNERVDVLADAYSSLLIRPTRNPALLVGLGEQFERGKLPGGDFPQNLQRLHSFLLLAAHMQQVPASDPFRTRTISRLTALLANGEPTLVHTLLDGARRSEVRQLMPILAKGVDGPIDRAFTHAAVSLFPDVYRDASSRPFWEEDVIWTTSLGLGRREAELTELREVKIPANSEAIGKAASYGDLSENSEWEAAMEEQRNLTARAMEIEEELRRAQLIENAAIPEGVVAPGTRVRYRDGGGDERTVQLLGPWDSSGEDDISYRSPLAQAMLGSKVGAEVEVQLPTGTTMVEVLEVSVLPLGAETTA
jgi:transcription elongation factor GreA